MLLRAWPPRVNRNQLVLRKNTRKLPKQLAVQQFLLQPPKRRVEVPSPLLVKPPSLRLRRRLKPTRPLPLKQLRKHHVVHKRPKAWRRPLLQVVRKSVIHQLKNPLAVVRVASRPPAHLLLPRRTPFTPTLKGSAVVLPLQGALLDWLLRLSKRVMLPVQKPQFNPTPRKKRRLLRPLYCLYQPSVALQTPRPKRLPKRQQVAKDVPLVKVQKQLV